MKNLLKWVMIGALFSLSDRAVAVDPTDEQQTSTQMNVKKSREQMNAVRAYREQREREEQERENAMTIPQRLSRQVSSIYTDIRLWVEVLWEITRRSLGRQ